MKILSVTPLKIPDIKVIRFTRFRDDRGYFTEPYRMSDMNNQEELTMFKDSSFVQTNESYSKANVMRGLHFQWNPYMGKLVRTVHGRMVDMVLDIRKGSPTLGKIIAYNMPNTLEEEYNEWIWVPPGFAHGNFFTEPTIIEYYCTGEYSPGCEAGISPLSKDIDWSLCDQAIKSEFDALVAGNVVISEKDKNGVSLTEWLKQENSGQFVYNKLT